MIPTIELSLTHTDTKCYYYTMQCRSDTKTVTHNFQVLIGEPDDISGKKRMMDFMQEITAQYEQDLQL